MVDETKEQINEEIKDKPNIETNVLDNPTEDEVFNILEEIRKELANEEKEKSAMVKKEQLKSVAKELLKKQTESDNSVNKELEETKKKIEEQEKLLNELRNQSQGSKVIKDDTNPLSGSDDKPITTKDWDNLMAMARNYNTNKETLSQIDYSKYKEDVYNYVRQHL